MSAVTRSALARAAGAGALVLGSLAAVAWGPMPRQPMVLGCVGDLQWTEVCRAVGPEPLAESVAPEELARRVAANWDYDPENGLWRAGSIPLHLARRAHDVRETTDPEARGEELVRLASVIQAPIPYGGWVPDEAQLAADADQVSAAYRATADRQWEVHRARATAAFAVRTARRLAWAGAAREVLPAAFAAWLALTALAGGLALARRRAERPLRLRLDPHRLRLDETEIPTALLERVELRWGRLELLLRDGSTWASRPLEPRNPSRLELLVMERIPAPTELRAEGEARREVHRALTAVLERVPS